ncbi:metaxin-1-like [Thalassophryne amazonica]|uniref:metaxin-1-like n=1 Tax=Thalassophryne amazonica TaxID=390379 RepID=UPI001471F5EF|nr:metaxin-1-like [Thalassophryne amazonica]
MFRRGNTVKIFKAPKTVWEQLQQLTWTRVTRGGRGSYAVNPGQDPGYKDPGCGSPCFQENRSPSLRTLRGRGRERSTRKRRQKKQEQREAQEKEDRRSRSREKHKKKKTEEAGAERSTRKRRQKKQEQREVGVCKMELFCWDGDSAGLPSVSRDCLLLLAYAKFAGAPLKLHKICNPWRSPSGSLPALRIDQGTVLSRPSDIIIHLRKQKYNADYDLSATEGADSLAFISLMEEKLVPALIYAFWIEPKNYVEVTRRWYAEHIPFPLNYFLPGQMQRAQLEKLRLLRGDENLEAGEELEKELYRDASECMNLLSQRLGSQKFFFGDLPSSLDAYVFAHLAPILKSKLPNAKLQQHLKLLDNLSNFCTNILLLYFPRNSRETFGEKASTQSEGGDFDHVPNKRWKQLLSGLVALGAMLSYALLTGMVSIQHVQQEAHEEPPDLETLSPHDHEDGGEG